MKSVPNMLLFLALVQILVGCEPTTAPAEKKTTIKSYASLRTHRPLYGIGFYNDTGNILENVHLEFSAAGQKYYCPAGYLAINAGANDRGCPDPIPPEGTVFWTTPDGIEHNQHVLLTNGIKNQWWFDGTIWLKITNADVLVEPLTDAEEWERAKHQERQVP